ncbi:MAG TPA: Crp/Fnr family transcriptional regulator [Gemmatimonadaceae bacterium]|nr:Crp/Fnr family transcriptional regulator [Gemmatimonadaceae bacterium]
MVRSSIASETGANLLLSALAHTDRERLLPGLEPVELALGDVLHESSGRLEHAYFPTSAVVSMLYTMEDGATAEVGRCGNDGVVGVSLFLGGDTTPSRAVVQIAGAAMRMRARTLQAEFARGGSLQQQLLRYTQAFITQVAQTAVCNRLHSVEKRLCRMLLLSHDSAKTDELLMTQELIAGILGGRRESVTVAAAHLQDAGLIRYWRGHIRVLDRAGLERAACECYRVVRAESDRLLSVRAPNTALPGTALGDRPFEVRLRAD